LTYHKNVGYLSRVSGILDREIPYGLNQYPDQKRRPQGKILQIVWFQRALCPDYPKRQVFRL